MRVKQRRKPIAEINVVPYIDVMLVLLIIFMITAPLLSQGVKVDLPKAQTSAIATKDKKPIIVSIDKQGNYYLNVAEHPESPMMAADIVNRVTAEKATAQKNNEELTVLVKGDKDVEYGKVVLAMVLLQQAGIDKVGLMTQNPGEDEAK
jgi:biopolymer transport protein TolR